MKYTIAYNRKEEIEKMLNKFQRKAQRYGIGNVEYSFGEKYFETIPVYAVDRENHCQRKVRTTTVEAVDVTVNAEEIKCGDYKVVAMIEHLSEGANVVKTFGVDIKPRWMVCYPKCEHCKSNRNRKVTFIVEDYVTGEQKQIGKTCLKDYSGIDPEFAVAMRQLEDTFAEEDFSKEDYPYFSKVEQYVEVETALAYALEVYKKQGYVRTSDTNSNKVNIDRLICISEEKPKKEFVSKAKEIISEIKGFDSVTAYNNGFDNIWSIVQNEFVKLSMTGYISYIPVSYERYINRKNKKQKQIESESNSEYIGVIGKRQLFNIKETKILTSWRTEFGTTYLYKMKDENSNTIIVKTSSYLDVQVGNDFELFNSGVIKATVKTHEERDGIKQTVIQRVKIESVTSTIK